MPSDCSLFSPFLLSGIPCTPSRCLFFRAFFFPAKEKGKHGHCSSLFIFDFHGMACIDLQGSVFAGVTAAIAFKETFPFVTVFTKSPLRQALRASVWSPLDRRSLLDEAPQRVLGNCQSLHQMRYRVRVASALRAYFPFRYSLLTLCRPR